VGNTSLRICNYKVWSGVGNLPFEYGSNIGDMGPMNGFLLRSGEPIHEVQRSVGELLERNYQRPAGRYVLRGLQQGVNARH